MFKPRLSTVLAATALVVAVLGSTPVGQAAAKLILPKNSVGAAQLKKNAVNGIKVQNGTLMAVDFKAGQLPAGPEGPQGPKGAKGDAGPQGLKGVKGDAGPAGPQGLAGPAGIGGYVVVPTGSSVGANNIATTTAPCPAGKKPLGGGVSPGDSNVWVWRSYPTAAGWVGSVSNEGSLAHTYTVYVVCANVS